MSQEIYEGEFMKKRRRTIRREMEDSFLYEVYSFQRLV